jgi:hypothetical protein
MRRFFVSAKAACVSSKSLMRRLCAMSSRYVFSLANQCREDGSPRRSAGLIAPVCAALVMRDCNTFASGIGCRSTQGPMVVCRRSWGRRMTYQPFRPSRRFAEPSRADAMAPSIAPTDVAYVAFVAKAELKIESDTPSDKHSEVGSTPATYATKDHAVGSNVAFVPDPVPKIDPPTNCPVTIEAMITRLEETAPPGMIGAPRWDNMIANAREFSRTWGAHALGLRWTAVDLFGLHPCAPLTRHDCRGLALFLSDGDRIVAVTALSATIEKSSGTQQRFFRAIGATEAIPAWELWGRNV